MTPGVALLVGALVTGSNGLGYEHAYPGLQLRADYASGHFLARADANYLWAEKAETGDGQGQSLHLLAGIRGDSFDLLGGVSYSRQETSTYEKDKVRYVAESGWQNPYLRVAATYAGNGAPEESQAFGIRLESLSRFRLVATYEHIRFTDYFGNARDGDKATVAVLFRLIDKKWQRTDNPR